MKNKLEYRCYHSIENHKPKNEECKGCSSYDILCPFYHTNKSTHLNYNPEKIKCKIEVK